jgi:Ca2+-binding EF-hand superfamily protein
MCIFINTLLCLSDKYLFIYQLGMIGKNRFAVILRNIGLPFSFKDMNDIIIRYAVAPKFDFVDYNLFLNDAGVKSKYDKTEMDTPRDTPREGSTYSDLSTYTRVLYDVKRMLIETVKTLGRNVDDVYKMFGRWDNDGSGTITATQFLRVLVRLHVHLSDTDQDFLVDLLDTTSMGRIDFESLLDFCFIEINADKTDKSPVKNGPMSLSTNEGGGGDSGSVTSTVEQNSVGSNNKTRNRPHTATPSKHDLGYGPLSPDMAARKVSGSENGVLQRPITASARVGSSSEYRNNQPTEPPKGAGSRPQSAFKDRAADRFVCAFFCFLLLFLPGYESLFVLFVFCTYVFLAGLYGVFFL